MLPKLFDPLVESDDPIDAVSVQLDHGAITSGEMAAHLATLDNETWLGLDQPFDSLGWVIAV
jgi:hypothetical protein